MLNRLLHLTLPAALTLLFANPAQAQVQVSVQLGEVFIAFAPDAPPRPRVEVRLAQPSREHIWIGGCWERANDRWHWRQGRWERPVQHGSMWVEPRYERDGSRYRCVPGHWSHQQVREARREEREERKQERREDRRERREDRRERKEDRRERHEDRHEKHHGHGRD